MNSIFSQPVARKSKRVTAQPSVGCANQQQCWSSRKNSQGPVSTNLWATFSSVANCLVGIFPLLLTAQASLPLPVANRYVQAIYVAEGRNSARIPYGILSVRIKNAAEARAVCFRTVQNNHNRWLDAGCPGDFITFLGSRYCPASVDLVGNRNWVRNVRKGLRV